MSSLYCGLAIRYCMSNDLHSQAICQRMAMSYDLHCQSPTICIHSPYMVAVIVAVPLPNDLHSQ